MKERGDFFLLIGALALFLPSVADSRTWHILNNGSGDAASLQAGIDSSASGDTVMVYPGTYLENISFLGKSILVRSASGSAATVIDGSLHEASCVAFVNHENLNASLEGFTLLNGTGGPNVPGGEPGFGGGIIVRGASPTIRNNVITGNITSKAGGGIWCAGTSIDSVWAPRIEANAITGNSTVTLGGGIGIGGNMAPIILNNVITNNSVSEGDGGGIAFLARIDGSVLSRNQILSNQCGDHGGGIYFGSAVLLHLQVDICSNVVANNIAQGKGNTGNSGGGIWLYGASATVARNTIAFNEGRGGSTDWGGGLVLDQSGTSTVTANILAFNIGGGIWCGSGDHSTISNNLAWMNEGGDGIGACATWTASNGNILANPYFCDVAKWDLSVASNSTAITHPAGPLGAYPMPGCGPVTVLRTTWGRLKASHR